MVEIRPATQEDAESYFGSVQNSMRALVVVADGKPIGMAGIVYTSGGMMAFSDAKPEASKYPVTIMKCARRLMQWVRESSVPVYAMCGNDQTAPSFLRHLGFAETEKQGVYLWQS